MPKNPNVTVMVPKRSAFDWSHHNLLSQYPGTIVPIFANEVIPATKVNMKLALSVTMPPLVSDTYMRVSYKVEAFFCPYRILFGGYEHFLTQYVNPVVDYDADSSSNTVSMVQPNLPYLVVYADTVTPANNDVVLGPNTLMDYLGGKQFAFVSGSNSSRFNIFPFLAYHRIYQDFYRHSQAQQVVFASPNSSAVMSGTGSFYVAAMLPYLNAAHGVTVNVADAVTNNDSQGMLADSINILNLRQRNYGFDHFTNAYPTATENSMTVSTSGNSFTIASLRSSNSLQQFAERSQLAGYDYAQVIASRYGANLNKGVASRPVFLGSADYEIYSKGITVSSQLSDTFIPEGGTENPFLSYPGARVGNAFGSGSDSLIRGFECNEPGIIMVMGTVVPRATYGTGIRKYLKRYTAGTPGVITDLATPLLQNVGNEPIYQYELSSGTNQTAIFGFTDRFYSYMDMEDELHGDFVSGGLLEHFALQRSFASGPYLNTNFLEISTNALNDVLVSASYNKCWVDIDFDCKVLQPLYPYSMPSLQDPAYEHGRPVTVRRGGFRF